MPKKYVEAKEYLIQAKKGSEIFMYEKQRLNLIMRIKMSNFVGFLLKDVHWTVGIFYSLSLSLYLDFFIKCKRCNLRAVFSHHTNILSSLTPQDVETLWPLPADTTLYNTVALKGEQLLS